MVIKWEGLIIDQCFCRTGITEIDLLLHYLVFGQRSATVTDWGGKTDRGLQTTDHNSRGLIKNYKSGERLTEKQCGDEVENKIRWSIRTSERDSVEVIWICWNDLQRLWNRFCARVRSHWKKHLHSFMIGKPTFTYLSLSPSLSFTAAPTTAMHTSTSFTNRTRAVMDLLP